MSSSYSPEFYRKRYAYNTEFVQKLKVQLGCADCGWNEHHAGLEWDHIQPRLRGTVSSQLGKSLKVILEEIARCECVCGRCHKLRTWHRNHPGDCNTFVDYNNDKIARTRYITSELIERTLSLETKPPLLCVSCEKELSRRTLGDLCVECIPHPKKIDWPSPADIRARVDETSYVEVGKQLGVSDNAVRKYLSRCA